MIRRNTKLQRAVEQLDIHDHICLIYETQEEQFATVIPFITIGLERGERCMYIVDDTTFRKVANALKKHGVDVAGAIENGDLNIVEKQDAYLKKGYFDPAWMISYLKRATYAALSQGYTALRIAGEMTWCLSGDPGSERIVEYESRLNEFFPKYDALAMCQYNARRFHASTIKDVIYTHPLVAYGGQISKNHYYISPKEFKDNSDEAKVRSLLHHILTAQKQEEGRKRVERRLKEREDRFRALIEHGSDIIILSDGKGHYSYVSPSIDHILGYGPEEFKTLQRREFVHPEDMPLVTKDMEKILKTDGARITGKFRIKHKNGAWRWVESTATNLLHYPSVRSVVSNLRDVTQQEVLAKQKDEFIAIASHELKTPVTSIKAYAQLLYKRFKSAEDVSSAELMSKLDGQVNKLAGLISDLLDATRIDQGKLLFHEDEFNFNELVEEVIEEMQRTTTQHVLVKELDSTVIVFGDRDRIGQVIINLLSNAIKYSPDATKVLIKSVVQDNFVELSVKDDGIGLAKEDQVRVFERFYRVGGDKQETFPGLGLGLFICAEIIKRHQGHIWASGEKGHGTTFTFTLPIVHV